MDPQPVSVALLLMLMPLAKSWMPLPMASLESNVAASVPSPMTKSWLLLTNMLPTVSVPALNVNTLFAPLVSTS